MANTSPWSAGRVPSGNGLTVSSSPVGSVAYFEIGIVTASPARTVTEMSEATGGCGVSGAGTGITRICPVALPAALATVYVMVTPPAGTERADDTWTRFSSCTVAVSGLSAGWVSCWTDSTSPIGSRSLASGSITRVRPGTR